MNMLLGFLLTFVIIFGTVLFISGEWQTRVAPVLQERTLTFLGIDPSITLSDTERAAADSVAASIADSLAEAEERVILDWRSAQQDSMVRMRQAIVALRIEVGVLDARLGAILTARDDGEVEAWKTMAKLFAAMKSDEASGILTHLSDGQAVQLLASMKPRSSAELMGKLEPDRAARLSSRMSELLRDQEAAESVQ